jgi:hypothetical protein
MIMFGIRNKKMICLTLFVVVALFVMNAVAQSIRTSVIKLSPTPTASPAPTPSPLQLQIDALNSVLTDLGKFFTNTSIDFQTVTSTTRLQRNALSATLRRPMCQRQQHESLCSDPLCLVCKLQDCPTVRVTQTARLPLWSDLVDCFFDGVAMFGS